jgi:hypothetical protein
MKRIAFGLWSPVSTYFGDSLVVLYLNSDQH